MKNMDLRRGLCFFWNIVVFSCSLPFFTNAQVFGPPMISPMIMPRGMGGPPGPMPGMAFPGSFGAPTNLGGLGAVDSMPVNPSAFQIQSLQQRLSAFNNRNPNGENMGNTVLSQNGNRVNAMSTEAANRFIDMARSTNDPQPNMGRPDTPEIDFNRITDARSRFGIASGQHLVHQLSTPPEEQGSEPSSGNNNGGGGNGNGNGGNFQEPSPFGFNFNDPSFNPEMMQMQLDNGMQPSTFEDPRQGLEPLGRQNNNMNQNDVLRMVLGENSLPTQLFANAGSRDPMPGPLGMNMGHPGFDAMPPGMGNMIPGW